MKFSGKLLVAHASYIFITGLWPLVDIVSFMMVTGPKTDIWLVKTVGALLLPVSLTMFAFATRPSAKWPPVILGGGTAVSFLTIDLYYALSDVISDIYLADAGIQFIFLMCWFYFANRAWKEDGTARP